MVAEATILRAALIDTWCSFSPRGSLLAAQSYHCQVLVLAAKSGRQRPIMAGVTDLQERD
jgi:hypothetical protein